MFLSFKVIFIEILLKNSVCGGGGSIKSPREGAIYKGERRSPLRRSLRLRPWSRRTTLGHSPARIQKSSHNCDCFNMYILSFKPGENVTEDFFSVILKEYLVSVTGIKITSGSMACIFEIVADIDYTLAVETNGVFCA